MSFKEEYFVQNMKINNINKTIKNHILEYKRKLIRFIFDCRIDSMIEKYIKNNKVDLYITFYSEKKDVTHNYYLQCPKPMIENQMLKILDSNPSLNKSLGAYSEFIPLLDHVICKFWGRVDVIKKKKLGLDHNWYEFEPQQPSQDFLELMRSCGIPITERNNS